MSIEILSRLLLLPPSRIDTGSFNDWKMIEEKIATPLPDDYKHFIEAYGSGYIGNQIIIWNPFSSIPNINFVPLGANKLTDLRKVRVKYKREFNEVYPPYRIFPELGGVLPFGDTVSGDTFFWETIGHPNNWTVLFQENRHDYYEKHSYSLSDFLIRLIKKELPQSILYDEGINKWDFTPIESNDTA